MSQGSVLPKLSRICASTRVIAFLKGLARFKYIYLLLLPGIVYYVLFHYVPMYGVQLAFKEFSISKGIWGSPFVGLEKFNYVIFDRAFWRAIINTFIISFGKAVFVFPVPIILAVLINELKEGIYKRILQTVFTFPHFLSWVILSGVLINMFSNTGAANNLFAVLGFDRQAFLTMPYFFRAILYMSDAWKESGWESILYVAAIAMINSEIYEAAVIDGASRFQRIRHVTWPGIKSTAVVLLILRIGGTMTSGFDQIVNLYNPAVYDAADIITTYIYRVTFQMQSTDFGFSTALGLFNSMVNFILLLSANKAAKLLGQEGIF